MKTTVIIPARGGSTRVLNKNTREVGGKPLFIHAIDCCSELGFVDQIYVSSNSDEILSLARKHNALAHVRPDSLSTNNASVIDVVKDVIVSRSLHKKIVIVLLPTAPLRTPADVEAGFNLFKDHNMTRAIVSVCEYETPIQLAQYVDQDRLVPVFPDEYAASTKSTGHRHVVKFNEMFVINTAASFLKQTNLIGSNSTPFFCPEDRSLMIDYEFQMEALISYFNSN